MKMDLPRSDLLVDHMLLSIYYAVSSVSFVPMAERLYVILKEPRAGAYLNVSVFRFHRGQPLELFV